MPYYPTFAFFEDGIKLHGIAYSFLECFDNKIASISFEINSGCKKEIVSISSKAEAISFLDGSQNISYFLVKDDLNSVLFESYNTRYLEIKYWDFDGMLYDSNSITELMQEQKRNFALSIHETLLKHCGAKLSFTSSLDHKRYECEFDDDFDVAEFILDKFNQKQFNQILNLPQTTSWIWLLGIQKNILPIGILNEEVMQGFREVKNDETILILESVINQPTFMNDLSNDA